MKKHTRLSQQIILIGTNGTGKTSIATEIMNRTAANGRPVFIVHAEKEEKYDPVPFVSIKNRQDAAKCKRGIFAIRPTDHEFHRVIKKKYEHSDKVKEEEVPTNVFTYIEENVHNALIVFDDVRNYSGNQVQGFFKKMLVNRRQNRQDFLFMYHGTSDTPPGLWANATDFILLNTNDDIPPRINPTKKQLIQSLRAIVKENVVHNPFFGIHYDLKHNRLIEYPIAA